MKVNAWVFMALACLTAVALVGPNQPQYSAVVIDEKSVVLSMGGNPIPFRYGNHSFGTTELCVGSGDTTACYRTPDLDTKSRGLQKVHITAQWPYNR